MSSTSLLDWVDEQRKKKEEADKKAKADAAKYSRQAKDDVYVPPKPTPPPPVQDTRQEAIQAKRADLASLHPTPQPTHVYIPSVSTPQPSNVYVPQVGQSAPPQDQDRGTDHSLQSWKPKVSVPEFHTTVQPYKPPDVSFSFQRPDTGAAPLGGQPEQRPSTPLPYQPVTQPGTRNFLQANALGPQPFANYAAGAQDNMNFLRNAAPFVSGAVAAAGGPSALLGSAPTEINNSLKKWGLDWQNPQTPQTPMAMGQQPQVITGLQRPNTGVPGIGASGQSPTVGVNLQTPAKPLPGAGSPLTDYLATTGYGQAGLANMRKNWQGVDPNSWWESPLAHVKDLGAAASMLGGAVENVNIPGANVKVGQAVQAGLTVPARAINPFDKSSIWRNPATFNTPGVLANKNALADPNKSNQPISAMAPGMTDATPFAAVGSWMKDTFMSNWNKSKAVNQYIQSLPPDQQNKVQIAYSIMQSGPEATKNTVSDILAQPQKVAEYTKLAQEAQTQSANPALTKEQQAQAALRAAQYGKQAYAEKNLSALDYVDKNAHPGAQFVGSLVTDPLNYLPIDKLWHAYKAARTARIFDVSAEEALRVMPKALQDAEKILSQPLAIQDATKLVDAGAQKAAVLGPTYWEKINPFAQTPDTKAQMATNKIWTAATQLIKDVTSKEDAMRIVASWVDNPKQLIEGMPGLTSPAAQTASVNGVYKVGAGVIANQPLLDTMPVLKAAAEKLKSLESLTGAGTFDPWAFAGEVDNVVYDTARQIYGLDSTAIPQGVYDLARKAYGGELPAGAIKPVLRRLPDGTGVIDFVTTAKSTVAKSAGLKAAEAAAKVADKGAYTLVGKEGKLLGSTAPKVWYDAQQQFKALSEAGKTAGSSSIAKAAELPFQIQRAILSDMYLALNPGHWIRNAASATATLLTDGNYGTKNQGEMIRDLTSKFGDIFPERELQNTIAGTGTAIPHILERAIGENPYSSLVNKANEVWTGLTNVAGVPFGEQSFKLTAKYNSFQRIFRATWKDAAEAQMKAGLEGLGVAPEVANTLIHHVVDAGIQGNKQSLATATRKVLTDTTFKAGLRELGIPDELLSMEGWAKLSDVLGTHLPEQVNEATVAVKQIFTDELTHRAAILNEAPPQIGNPAWTKTEIAHDSASLIDSLRESGRQAGIDPQQVEATVQALAKQMEESMNGAWDKFRGELPQSQSPQDALSLAFDTYAKHNELKQAARAAVDQLSTDAVKSQNNQVWLAKWQGTQDIYTKLSQATQELFDGTRARMMGVHTGDAPVYDWWKAIERYANYDEAAVQTARTKGQALGSTANNQEAWTASIDAGRQFVDKSMLEVYDAFRRNPTQESLDLLVNAQKKIDYMGASVAAHLKPLREEARKTKIFGPYYTERNKVWGQFFDNAALHNKATQRTIIADGVTKQYAGALTWNDPMQGNLRLLAPDTQTLVNTTGEAQALRKAQTGVRQPRTTTFDTWQVVDEKGQIIKVKDEFVPEQVKAAWQKVTNPDEEVNALMGASQLPPTAEPLASPQDYLKQSGGKTATEIAQAKLAAQGSTPVTSLRQLADKAGIRVVDNTGKSVNTDVIRAINEDFKAKGLPRVNRLENLAPEQYAAARDALQGRVSKVFPGQAAQPATRTITGQQLMDINNRQTASVSTSKLSAVSEYAASEVQKTLDAGGQVVMWNDGKRIEIVGTKNGMALDAKGQQWGFMPLATGNPNARNEIELIEGAASNLPPATDFIKQNGGQTATEIANAKRAASKMPRPLAGSPAQEAIGQAQDSVKGLAEARSTMITQWDRQAVANWKLPQIDTLIARYERKGIVNVPEHMFEDLYGTTIAGHRINSQADVEAFLSEYAQIKRQAGAAGKAAEAGAATIEDLHGVAKSAGINTATGAGNPNDIYLVNAINVERRAQKLKSITLEQLNRDPALREQAAELLMNKIGPAEGPTIHGPTWDPFKLEAGQTVDSVLAENVAKSKQVNGNKAPEMGEALGTHMLDKLKAAEQTILGKLQEVLTGQPNTLTEAQRVGAMDLLNQLLPAYDNALAGASKGASDMMNFGMLDPSNRRNADVWLSHLFPFHYFWSRSAKNWAERVLVKPGVLNAYRNMEKNIAIENQQQNLPNRLLGTVQNPLAEAGIGPERLANPAIYALPFAGYYQNEYINPEAANSDFEKTLMRIQQFTPGLFPAAQAAVNYGLDIASPKADGSKRFDASQYAPAKMVPAVNMIGGAYQAVTGNTSPQLPGNMGPLWGDKFDPYRTGRKASELAIEQKLDPLIAQYAEQIAKNRQKGVPDLTDIPPEYQKAAATLFPQATQGSAKARLWADAGRFLTGVPGYQYTPQEAQMQQAQKDYGAVGYGPDNQFGSKAARNELLKQNQYLPDWWSKSALVPGSDKQAPAVSAQRSQAFDAQDTLYNAGNSAVDTLQKQNPKASKADIYKARLGGVVAQAEQIAGKDAVAEYLKTHKDATPGQLVDFVKSQKWPLSSTPLPQSDNPLAGMNPQEQQQAEINQGLRDIANLPGAPKWPGDNATKQQKADYYKALGAYKASQEQAAGSNLVQSAGEHGRPLLTPEAAKAAWADYKTRNMTDAERTRVDTIEQEQAAKQAEYAKNPYGDNWKEYLKLDGAGKAEYMRNHPDFAKSYINKYGKDSAWWNKAGGGTHYKRGTSQKAAAYQQSRSGVVTEFGNDAAAIWEGYGKLPKGSKARDDYKAAHPELRVYDMAAYNPKEYADAKKTFGDNAWMEWAQAPSYGTGTPDEKAARAQYFDAHPTAKLLNAWVNGRPSAAGERPSTEGTAPGAGIKHNFGQDYADAQKQFGPDIWNIFAGYKNGFDKAAKADYLKKYPQLGNFFSWWYGNDKSGGAYASKGYSRYGGGFSRGFSGGGFSFGGGGGGGGGGAAPPHIAARTMDQNLQITDADLKRNLQNAWRPHNIDLSWMQAGQAIGPDNLKKWKR